LGGAGRDGDCCSEDLDGKKDGTQKRATINRELSKLMVTLVACLDATDDRKRLAATRTFVESVLVVCPLSPTPPELPPSPIPSRHQLQGERKETRGERVRATEDHDDRLRDEAHFNARVRDCS
jgi:hypothetical protein